MTGEGRRATRRPRARWRSVVLVVIAANVAAGLLVSVLALRHEADRNRQARVELARLEASATQLAADLLVCGYALHAGQAGLPQAGACPATAADVRSVELGYGRVAALVGDAEVLGALGEAIAAVPSPRSSAYGAYPTGRAASDGWLAETRDRIRELSRFEADSAARNGMLADVETVLLMVTALGVAVTLFRGFDSARRDGRVRALAARARAEARFRALVTHTTDVILVLGDEGEVRWRSPSSAGLIGLAGAAEEPGPGEPVPRLLDLVHEDDRAGMDAALRSLFDGDRGEVRHTARWLDRHGGVVRIEAVLSDLRANPDVRGVVLNGHDVTAARELEDQLRRQAFVDPLTGLPNRALFADRLEQAFLLRGRGPGAPAVVTVDLDAFRVVNDAGGHGAGDEVLRHVARCLAEAARSGDTVARVGADEFAVLLQPGAEGDPRLREGSQPRQGLDPVAFADRLLGALRRIAVRASLGIVVLDDEVEDADQLLRRAGLALQAAKGKGGDCAVAFEARLHASALERSELRSELAGALARDELRVLYQPAVDVRSGELKGVEALIRWEHPKRGTVSPAVFVPVAEETGDIVEFGGWVLRTACEQTRAWQQRYPRPGLPPLYLSVNVSVRQLREPGLVEEVRAALDASRLPARSLTLEITESQVIDDREAAIDALQRLRDLGCKVAVDDFGTGYSSLSYLQSLPVDVLKVDQSFVRRMIGSEEARVLVASIVAMARGLGMEVVAEGVEDRVQARMLASLHCKVAQGFLWARPLTAAAVATLLEEGGVVEPSAQRPAVVAG